MIRHLRSRYVLWLHGWVMGLLTLGVTWLSTTVLRHVGVESLAVRYAVALGAGYLAYLLLARIWAGMLVRQQERQSSDFSIDLPSSSDSRADGGWHSGGGGHFDGGGADASFDLPVNPMDGSSGEAAESVLSNTASGVLHIAGAADEGTIVVIPVLAVFAAALMLLFGAGCLLLAWFGTDVILTTAVELAFAYTAARTVVRVEREGWLLAAIRLTWKPLLGALICAVLLGALIDHFLPQANTLPEAVRIWREHSA